MAVKAVYEYLKFENRPYSANDIVTNLRQEFSKSVVQKALDTLVEKEKIFEKTYGKQRIFCVVQDSAQEPHELTRIQKELESHANEVFSKKLEIENELRAKEAELASLESSLSIEEARKEAERLSIYVNTLEKKLETFFQGNKDVDLEKVKKESQKQRDLYARECSKRKRICLEMIDAILEGYPGTKNELYDEIGMEKVDI